MSHTREGEKRAPAEQSSHSCFFGLSVLQPARPQTPMTKHTGFRRACSLRAPKAPGLLDRVPGSSSSYGSLEEAPLPWEAPWRAEGSLGHSQEGASQEAARKKGRGRALSLQGQDVKDEEPTPAGEASDGQLLVGQARGKAQASNRVKRCQKQVNRTLQRGWESFLANVHRLRLMRSASLPAHRR